MSETARTAKEWEWAYGLRNMLIKENGLWTRSYRWLVQSIIWSLAITGSVSFVMYLVAKLPAAVQSEVINSYGMGAAALQFFFNIAGFVSVTAVIILTHDLVISERESGTAEWVMSKPLSRKAFILSKFFTSLAWISLIIVVLQGILLPVVARLFGGIIELIPFLKGLSLIWLICLFYISMVIFLGTMTVSRGTVFGVSFCFFLLGSLVPLLFPESYYFMPWKLADIAFSVAMCVSWSPRVILPVILTSVWSGLFIAGALWRIEKIEI